MRSLLENFDDKLTHLSNNNNNTSICKARNVSKHTESEAHVVAR